MKKSINKIKYSEGRADPEAGMTLIELLVVLAIFIIVAGLTIFDYGRFRSSASLQNLADDVGLSIRRAQSYAIGVRNASSSFSNGYGIHISTSTNHAIPLAGSNKGFVIFADLGTPGDKIYQYNNSSLSTKCDNTTVDFGTECLDFLNITSNDQIVSICPNGSSCTTGYTDIVFNRPNPDAHICIGPENGACSGAYTSVGIVVRDDLTGDTKTITVSNIGQIGIK
jgi:prepilin-type N-terminal cleavage/methylation domain-containing protein